MKKIIGSSALILAMVLAAQTTFAAEKRPCGNVWKACHKANKGNKEATKSCVDTIKGGGTVPGVTATASDACKAMK